MSPPEVTVDALLAQRGWVRALARTLVKDEHGADDVEQDAWLAALRRPPREGGSLRAWFASVVRSRVRDRRRADARRTDRETAAARPEAAPSSADVASATEIHRDLAAALLALEEPYRSAVILRYLEDLPPREIAARTGVPVETARTHVKRGIERLRERLDVRHGGDRRAWRALVAPLAAGRRATATLGGGAIVGTKKTAAVAALLLLALGAGGAAWLAARGGEPRVVAETAAAPADPVRPPRAGRLRPQDAAPPSTASATAGTAEEPDRPVVAVVDGATRRPLEGAEILVVRADGSTTPGVALADARFALEPALAGTKATLWASAPGHARRRIVDLALAAGPVTIALERAEPLRLTFVTDAGRALDAAEVRARFGGAPRPGAFALVADDAFRGRDVAHTLRVFFGPAADWRSTVAVDDDGASLRLTDGAAAGRWRLFVERPGATPWLSEPFDGEGTAAIAVTIPEWPRARRVRFVADDTGTPLADAGVVPWYEFGENTPPVRGAEFRADAQGAASLPYEPPEARRDGCRAQWQVEAPGRAAVVDAWRALDEAPAADPVEIAVRRSVAVEGEAYLPDGRPAEGRRVVTGDIGFPWDAIVGADGRFRIDGIPAHDGRVDLILYAGSSVAQTRAEIGQGGVAHAVLGAKSVPATGRIAGRVTTGGAPLAGAFVCDQPANRQGSFVRTDADGRFVLDGLDVAEERDLVVYLGDPQADDSRCRIRTTAPLHLDAARPLAFAFDLPSGAVRARVLDAATGAAVAAARVSARPADLASLRTRFPGFDYGAGWAEFTGENGVALLRALPSAASHTVRAEADGYEPGERTDVVPGTADAPAEVELRLSRR